MCILLTRKYACWGMDEGEPKGHYPRYIRRCAIPDPSTCFNRNALYWRTEFYNTPCAECTGRFIAPSRDPFNVSTRMRLNKEANDAAAIAYAKALCFFLYCMLRYHRYSDDDAITDVYKACKIEVACRFDKDHFEEGAYCPCQEANEWPEYRNLSAALRRLPARGLLYPGEADVATRDWEMADDYPDIPLLQACVEFFEAFCAQPLPGDVNPTIRDVPVLPFYYNRHRRNGDLFNTLVFKIDEAFRYYDDDEGWADEYLAHFAAPEDEDPLDWARLVLGVRRNLLYAVAHLVATDSGLPERRAHVVLDLFLNLAHIGEDWAEGPLHDQVASEMLDLADPDQWDPQITVFAMALTRTAKPVADFFLDDNVFLEAEYHLSRSAELRVTDEHRREDAVDASLGDYATQEECDALDETDRLCFICRTLMSVMGDGRAPPTNEDESFAFGHEAVRIKCRRGHLVGKKCFMEYWRTRRLVEGSNAVLCDLCGRQPLAPTPPKYLAYDLTLGEVMKNEFRRPTSWNSRAPERWLHYG